jgi:hypothetical protein
MRRRFRHVSSADGVCEVCEVIAWYLKFPPCGRGHVRAARMPNRSSTDTHCTSVVAHPLSHVPCHTSCIDVIEWHSMFRATPDASRRFQPWNQTTVTQVTCLTLRISRHTSPSIAKYNSCSLNSSVLPSRTYVRIRKNSDACDRTWQKAVLSKPRKSSTLTSTRARKTPAISPRDDAMGKTGTPGRR